MTSEGAAPEGPKIEAKTTARCHGVKVTERNLSMKLASEAPMIQKRTFRKIRAGRIGRRPGGEGPWAMVRDQRADERQEH